MVRLAGAHQGSTVAGLLRLTLVLDALTPATCQDALYVVDVLKAVCDGQLFETDLKHLPVSYTNDLVLPAFYRSSLKAMRIVLGRHSRRGPSCRAGDNRGPRCHRPAPGRLRC